MKANKVIPTLVNELRQKFGPDIKAIKAEDVRIGLAYTGVKISGNRGGVACTPLYEFSGCPALGFAGKLKGRPVDELLEMALSSEPLQAAVGVAAANALAHRLLDTAIDSGIKTGLVLDSALNVLDLVRPWDKVSMVGYFKPLVPKILKRKAELTVLEKREVKSPKVKILASEKAKEIVPASDVVILSASTLANGSIDELLAFAATGKAREIILLGPSAPLYPIPFFERGVTALMGTKITDTEGMLTVLSEGGGTKKLHRGCGEKVAFRKEN
ncbi:MAG: DUF364 domain-containing protein [Methanosarcinaceae archaeon]|nr:DUF364 domain-containing protein [Methanosarcinaceae archaeon]MDD4331569.1 DUF364 domain-containing protein [Methanosarcinaceae archaeon]